MLSKNVVYKTLYSPTVRYFPATSNEFQSFFIIFFKLYFADT